MCGICGAIGIGRGEEAEAVVRRMMSALRHRGPDDEGLLIAPPVALGMRRLSIIDLAGGHQPVFNEERSVGVVFNGEIYNFQELRRTLESQGHTFRTRSDTEVIVHAYEAWGEECVRRLRGMFSFAVLDARQGAAGPRVFLARDRLGIKPLYYAGTNGVLLFASEVRALLASGWFSPSLSRSSVESYLLFGSVAEPMTLVEGVFSLPPGHCLCVTETAAPFDLRPKAYWRFGEAARNPAQEKLPGPLGAAQSVRTLLEEAVRTHLVADVPLGIFLSSGLDSTALVALASRERAGIHTFTVVFPEQDFSEAALARHTAERFGTQHQEMLLTEEKMVARLEEAVAALDQPSMDGINTFFVSWAARQVGLKVALSGLGGDEVFGGYNSFRVAPRLRRLAAAGRWLPAGLRAATSAALLETAGRVGRADATRKLAALWRSPDSFPQPYFFVRGLFTPEQASGLLRGTSGAADSLWWAWLASAAEQADGLDDFTAVSLLESRSYLVNTLLRDTDAVSMSHSLEVRVPFLDHPLVEHVAGLPGRVKRGGKKPKALLVAALADLLPDEIVEQRKRTFTLPWERWLRGALGARVAAGLEDLTPVLLSVMDQHTVRSVWHDFLAGRTSWSRPWSLYVLNEWTRRHLEGSASRPATGRAAVAVASTRLGAAGGASD